MKLYKHIFKYEDNEPTIEVRKIEISHSATMTGKEIGYLISSYGDIERNCNGNTLPKTEIDRFHIEYVYHSNSGTQFRMYMFSLEPKIKEFAENVLMTLDEHIMKNEEKNVSYEKDQKIIREKYLDDDEEEIGDKIYGYEFDYQSYVNHGNDIITVDVVAVEPDASEYTESDLDKLEVVVEDEIPAYMVMYSRNKNKLKEFAELVLKELEAEVKMLGNVKTKLREIMCDIKADYM